MNSSPLNQIFPHIYLINLKRRRDKLDLMKFKLDKLGIQYTIFEAIDGLDPTLDQLTTDIWALYNNLSRGAIGLLLTYYKLLSEVISHNYPNVLFLEDDCNFIKDLNTKIIELKWHHTDIIYLGANQVFFDPTQLQDMLNGSYALSTHPMSRTFGTYAIAFKLEFCKRLYDVLDQCLNLKTNLESIDVCIHHLCNNLNMNSKIIYPYLVMPDVTTSDILSKRNQQSFCLVRKYKIEDYDYLSVNTLNMIRSHLHSHGISLRHVFWELYQTNPSSTPDDIIKQLNQSDPTFNLNLTLILKYLSIRGTINLVDFMELIEGSNTKFICIIPSYNNKDNYDVNLNSVILQSYPNYLFRIIYIDDQSTDSTYDLVQEKIKFNNQVKLIKQQVKGGQCVGRYIGYHMAYDMEVVVFLDGDDWLSSTEVFNVLNDLYLTQNFLKCTYGSHYIYSNPTCPKEITSYDSIQSTRSYPQEIIKSKSYRNYDWICGHLRTCRAYLAKNISLKDLIHSDGMFYKVATDRAEMLPILEMSGNSHLNTQIGMYVYNKVNSELYDTSYYKSDSPYATYRKEVVQHQNRRVKYDTLDNISSDHQYTINGSPEEILKLTKLIIQTGAAMVTSCMLKPTIYNHITTNTDYVAFIVDVNPHLELENLLELPSIRDETKLPNLANEVVICRFEHCDINF